MIYRGHGLMILRYPVVCILMDSSHADVRLYPSRAYLTSAFLSVVMFDIPFQMRQAWVRLDLCHLLSRRMLPRTPAFSPIFAAASTSYHNAELTPCRLARDSAQRSLPDGPDRCSGSEWAAELLTQYPLSAGGLAGRVPVLSAQPLCR